jgi:hypothetical protein
MFKKWFFRLIGLPIAVLLIASWLIPFSFFYMTHSIKVSDSIYGNPVLMVVDVSINRNFTADWKVSIKSVPGRNTICSSGANRWKYKATETITNSMSLMEWSHGNRSNCTISINKYEEYFIDIPPGTYIVTSERWIYNPIPFGPKKYQLHETIPFIILPEGSASIETLQRENNELKMRINEIKESQ